MYDEALSNDHVSKSRNPATPAEWLTGRVLTIPSQSFDITLHQLSIHTEGMNGRNWFGPPSGSFGTDEGVLAPVTRRGQQTMYIHGRGTEVVTWQLFYNGKRKMEKLECENLGIWQRKCTYYLAKQTCAVQKWHEIRKKLHGNAKEHRQVMTMEMLWIL